MVESGDPRARKHLVWLAVAVLVVSGCFGGPGAPPATPPPGPPPTPPVQPPTSILSPVSRDHDRNRIFDDLDTILNSASDSDHFKVIVEMVGPIAGATIQGLENRLGSFTVLSSWNLVPGFAANMTKSQIVALARFPDVRQIESDAADVKFDLSTARASAGVDVAFDPAILNVDGSLDGNRYSFSEDDVVVCVVDTGVQTTHPAFRSGVPLPPPHVPPYNQQVPNAPNNANWWKDLTPSASPNPIDLLGHGTQMSSIIVGHDMQTDNVDTHGNPSDTPLTAPHRGVAPGAALAVVRATTTAEERVDINTLIDGLSWCAGAYVPAPGAAPEGPQHVDIISASWGIDTMNCNPDNTMLMQTVSAVENLGIIEVFAAGNDGPATCTINEPAVSDSVIAVGMVGNPKKDHSCQLNNTSFLGGGWYLDDGSARGSKTVLKPDILAPGVCISAAKAVTAESPLPTPYYAEGSGTSPATAFVAGVVALMLGITEHKARSNGPHLTPEWVKKILKDTSLGDWGPQGPDGDFGAGVVRARAAIVQACKEFFPSTSWTQKCKVDATTGLGIGSNVDPPQPGHFTRAGRLRNGTAIDKWHLVVSDSTWPTSISLIMPEWTTDQTINFDLQLESPDQHIVARTQGTARQETLSILASTQRSYTLWVVNNSLQGTAGSYILDASMGGTIDASPFQDQ